MLRSLLITVIVVVAMLFAVGCAQPSSPASPSAIASAPGSPSSLPSSVRGNPSSAQSAITFGPLLAELHVAGTLLVNANRQLNRCVDPPPTDPEKAGWYFHLDFDAAKTAYEKSASKLDGAAPNYDPLALGTDALNRIIEQANIPLKVNLPPLCPAIPEIKIQAQHIISVATTLISCQKFPCF